MKVYVVVLNRRGWLLDKFEEVFSCRQEAQKYVDKAPHELSILEKVI